MHAVGPLLYPYCPPKASPVPYRRDRLPAENDAKPPLRRRARQALMDAIHLSETQRSDVGVQLLYSLREMAARRVGCASVQLAQATVVGQSIVAHGAHDDRRKYRGSFLVLPRLAEQLAM